MEIEEEEEGTLVEFREDQSPLLPKRPPPPLPGFPDSRDIPVGVRVAKGGACRAAAAAAVTAAGEILRYMDPMDGAAPGGLPFW